MKKIILVISIFMNVISLAGEMEVNVDDFTKITAVGNFKVSLVKSTETKVQVINNDDKVTDEDIVIEVKATELILKIKNDTYKQRSIEFIVYYNEVFEIHAKRGVIVKADSEFKSDKIDLSVNTGGHIVVKVDCNTVDVTIKNGGTIRVAGTSENANYFISKGGNIAGFNLRVDNVKSEVLFGGEILLNVTKSLYAVVKSGGTIKYKGKPEKVDESVKIGGKIVKLDK
jgi:hypothetical protein